jgi:hypothetical protein
LFLKPQEAGYVCELEDNRKRREVNEDRGVKETTNLVESGGRKEAWIG